MNIKDIKVGDIVHCERVAQWHIFPGVDGRMRFHGKVEKIEGDLIHMDNPAVVRIDKVLRVEKFNE